MISRPTPIQRCGIGSACDCPAHDKLAGIQRDLRLATSGGGVPLPAGTRTVMERAFAADFAAVRVHTGPNAHDVAAALRARALTAGAHILFHSGAFRPGTPDGDRLLAHELAHVVQQTQGLPRAALDGGTTDPLERAASLAADRASPAAEHEARGAALRAADGAVIPALSSQPLRVARQALHAGVPSDAGARPEAGTEEDPAHRSQTRCVIRLGGCPSSRPGGIPSAEEITAYNAQCRGETSYTGPDVYPTDAECRNPPAPGSIPGIALTGSTSGMAMICSKRLEASVVGWFANHSYIDDTGGGDCRGASKVGNYAIQTLWSGNFRRGCALKTDTSTDPQQYTPNVKPCAPKAGVSDVHACLRDAFNAYANPSEYVNPGGPNSNTFAATLAKACCADSSDSGLGWVPGWDHAPAGSCPTAILATTPTAEPKSPAVVAAAPGTESEQTPS
jgi:hypothetical protein